MELVYLGGEQWLTQVRPAVDQQAFAGAFDQNRGTQAGIARLVRIALSPFVPDLRHARRCAAAEDADLQGAYPCAFLNSLKKLAVVVSASSSGCSPLRAATNLAVSAINAGSHF